MSMTIRKTIITVKELVEGYVNDTEIDIEEPVKAYGGRLCVRPAFQRSFVYDRKQENAVIDTVLKGYPLNIMYWVDNGDGTYDCLDGQQRTISICNFEYGSTYQGTAHLSHDTAITRPTPLETLKMWGDADKFYDYELEVYICKGSKAEQLEWFNTVNIAGEELTSQELRNASFTSKWLHDAKRYFSSASANSSCPAERVGGLYTNKKANRQEILEQVLGWIADGEDDNSIRNYMENHMNDENANELIQYFEKVIEWVKDIFVNHDGKNLSGMKSVKWGLLYNHYKDVEFDPEEVENTLMELLEMKTKGEITSSVQKILEYCITRDAELLKQRAFSEEMKQVMYKKQKGICPLCGEHVEMKKMEAHHRVPWFDGGETTLENGVLICKKCHKKGHATIEALLNE